MSILKGVPCLQDLNDGCVQKAADKSDPLYRSLKCFGKNNLESLEDVEDNEVLREEVNRQESLTNVLVDVSTTLATKSAVRENVLIEPPPDAFQGIGKKMAPITKDGGLLKVVLVDGYSDCPISETDYVSFNYSGWLDGKTEPFTSSYFERKLVERQIGGVGSIFEGLDLALMSMKKGEIAFFLTCPAYSYGPSGTFEEKSWPEIKNDQWLLWKIQVVNVISAADHVADIFTLSPDDRAKLPFAQLFATVSAEHKLGKEAFKNHRFSHAKRNFERAAKVLIEPNFLEEREAIEKKKMLSDLFCDIAICIYQLELKESEESRNFQDVYENAASATTFNESNAKAWYWGGVALRHLYRLEESREFLTKAAKLAPNDAKVGDEIRALESDFREQKEREKAILRKMVGVDNDGNPIRKIPVEVENAVPDSFRKFISKELENAQSEEDYYVRFNLAIYNKLEISYINAAILCCDDSKIEVTRFTSEFGYEVINVANAGKKSSA